MRRWVNSALASLYFLFLFSCWAGGKIWETPFSLFLSLLVQIFASIILEGLEICVLCWIDFYLSEFYEKIDTEAVSIFCDHRCHVVIFFWGTESKIVVSSVLLKLFCNRLIHLLVFLLTQGQDFLLSKVYQVIYSAKHTLHCNHDTAVLASCMLVV